MIPNLFLRLKYRAEYKIAKENYNALKRLYLFRKYEYEKLLSEITVSVINDYDSKPDDAKPLLPKGCIKKQKSSWTDRDGTAHCVDNPPSDTTTCEFFDKTKPCGQNCEFAPANLSLFNKFKETNAAMEKLNDYWSNWKEQMKKQNRAKNKITMTVVKALQGITL